MRSLFLLRLQNVLLSLFFLPLLLCAKTLNTFYGEVEVEEPLLWELIESPAFQRLKLINQYGAASFTTHTEKYTRYDHSLGVFALLRAQHLSLEEQIAGLLHDVSHTAFSHVGDWIYGKENQEKNYQDSVHEIFLKKSGIAEILQKYDISMGCVLPTEELCPALDSPLPDLCADRIDYNIQGAYHQGFITYEEAQRTFQGFRFIDGIWMSNDHELLKKLVRFSLFMTEDCWGSAANYLASRWLADAILRGIDLGSISHEEIQLGTDACIWDKLIREEDPCIQQKMNMVRQVSAYYSLAAPAEADLIVKSRFRGVDPWVYAEGKLARLTSLDSALEEIYKKSKEKIQAGWAIKMTSKFYEK